MVAEVETGEREDRPKIVEALVMSVLANKLA